MPENIDDCVLFASLHEYGLLSSCDRPLPAPSPLSVLFLYFLLLLFVCVFVCFVRIHEISFWGIVCLLSVPNPIPVHSCLVFRLIVLMP